MVNLSKKFGLTDLAYFDVGIGTNESLFGGPINGQISDYFTRRYGGLNHHIIARWDVFTKLLMMKQHIQSPKLFYNLFLSSN